MRLTGKDFTLGESFYIWSEIQRKVLPPFSKFGNLQWLSGSVGPYNASYMHENIENVRDQGGFEVLHEKWLKIDQTLV